MFGDMAMMTIWVSLNVSIMMLVMFLYHIGRTSREENYPDGVFHEKRTE